MYPKKRQVGGRIEAPVPVVGSSGLAPDQQQGRVYTPEDAEYQSYSELFDTIARWKDIFEQYASPYIPNIAFPLPTFYPTPYAFQGLLYYGIDAHSIFWVVKTPKGLERVVRAPFAPELSHSVLIASMDTGHEGSGMTQAVGITMEFSQNPADVETQLLSDFNGVRPTSVAINLCDLSKHLGLQYLEICTSVPYDEATGTTIQNVRYELAQGKFNIVRGYRKISNYQPMSDANAIHFINTIDRLISNTTNPIPQNERRASQEIPTPLAPPNPGRRPPQ